MQIRRTAVLMVMVLFVAAGVSRADFKYTEQSRVTGGALVNMTKALGVLGKGKEAQQITEPHVTTIAIKGNRLRREETQGKVSIIDLDGRRFIEIDPTQKTYAIVTFDEMKAAVQRAQERAKEEQAKMAPQHPQAQNVKMIPHLEMQETGATRNILGLPTNEVKMKFTMELQSDDPKLKQQMTGMSYWFDSDSWITPALPGSQEVAQFYVRMSKEIDYVPMQSMGGNAMMGQAMEEFKKNSIKLKGLPLLQNASFGMAGMGGQPGAPASAQQAQAAQRAQAAQPAQDQESSGAVAPPPTSAKDALTKGVIGGVFGGLRKKKQQPDQQPAPQSASGNGGTAAGTQPSSNPNSMIDLVIEVTAFSPAPLDKSLFDVPAGFTQVQPKLEQELGGKPGR